MYIKQNCLTLFTNTSYELIYDNNYYKRILLTDTRNLTMQLETIN